MKKKVVLMVCMIVFCGSLFSQRRIPAPIPKLVLVLMVEDLQTEHFHAFQSKLGDSGFKKLMTGGMFYGDARYNHISSYNGVNVASFFTGAYPAVHGIVSDKWFDSIKEQEETVISASTDKDSVSFPSFSASRVECSTVGDELKMVYRQAAKVGAVGLEPVEAVLAAGHAGDHVFWLDDSKGRMATSGFFQDSLSSWVKAFNSKDFASMYLERQWGPLMDLKKYHEFIYGSAKKAQRSFLYDLDKGQGLKSAMEVFKGSPFANVLVRDFAVSLMINESYGKDEVPDILTLNFTCRPAVNDELGMLDAEVEDLFLRLDGEIASLLEFVDDEVGLQNALVVLTSSGNSGRMPNELASFNIPGGVFNGRKIASLLNLYLMAMYGQGKWVKGYHDGNFYLNHDLLDKSAISIDEVKKNCSAFLLQVSGVSLALTSEELRSKVFIDGARRGMQNSYHTVRSGDILVALQPGWVEQVDEGDKALQGLKVKNQPLPLCWYGWKIPKGHVGEQVEMIQVAPSIANCLKIRVPNGCLKGPLEDVLR